METKRQRTSIAAEPVQEKPVYDPLVILKPRLRIDKNNLDDELVEHPGLLFEVATGYALAMSDRDAQKEYLNQIEGRIRMRVTAALSEAGSKTGVKEVDAALEADGEWIRERKRYHGLCTDSDRWFALKEAFTARGFALHNLTAITVTRMKAEGGQSEYDPHEVRQRDRRREVTEGNRG